MTGYQIAVIAKERLAQLTGLEADTVSSMSKDEEGWHINVDLIQLKRIPEGTDVVAVYETVLDDEGELIRYERVRAYQRSQTFEPE